MKIKSKPKNFGDALKQIFRAFPWPLHKSFLVEEFFIKGWEYLIDCEDGETYHSAIKRMMKDMTEYKICEPGGGGPAWMLRGVSKISHGRKNDKIVEIRSNYCDFQQGSWEIYEKIYDSILIENNNKGLHFEDFTEKVFEAGFCTNWQQPSLNVKEIFQPRYSEKKYRILKYVSPGKNGVYVFSDPENSIFGINGNKGFHKRNSKTENNKSFEPDSLLDGLSNKDRESIDKKERFPTGVLPWRDVDGNIIPLEEMNQKAGVVYLFKCDQFEDGLHMLYIGSKIGNYGKYAGSGRLWKKKLKEHWENTGEVPIIERTLLSEHADNEETWTAEEIKLEEVDAANNDEYANLTNKANRRKNIGAGQKTYTKKERKKNEMLVIQVESKPVNETSVETEPPSCENIALLFLRSKSRPVHEMEVGGHLLDLRCLKEIENRSVESFGRFIGDIMRKDERFVETSSNEFEESDASKKEDFGMSLAEVIKFFQSGSKTTILH